MDAPTVRTAPSPTSSGGGATATALSSLDRSDASSLLERYFRVAPEIVRGGFRGVDGATLGFYEDADFENAGVESAPLRRRLAEELAAFKAAGLSAPARAALAPPAPRLVDAACSPGARGAARQQSTVSVRRGVAATRRGLSG